MVERSYIDAETSYSWMIWHHFHISNGDFRWMSVDDADSLMKKREAQIKKFQKETRTTTQQTWRAYLTLTKDKEQREDLLAGVKQATKIARRKCEEDIAVKNLERPEVDRAREELQYAGFDFAQAEEKAAGLRPYLIKTQIRFARAEQKLAEKVEALFETWNGATRSAEEQAMAEKEYAKAEKRVVEINPYLAAIQKRFDKLQGKLDEMAATLSKAEADLANALEKEGSQESEDV